MGKTKRTIGVNLEGADLELLRGIAARERRSISFILREIVSRYLQCDSGVAAATSSPAATPMPMGPSEAGGAPSNLARSLFTAAANLDQLATAAWRNRIAPEELGQNTLLAPTLSRKRASD